MEKIRQFILLCIYTFAPPVYMMSVVYLLRLYRDNDNFGQFDLLPIFWETVWVPALLGMICNHCLRQYRKKHLQPNEKVRDYPLIFVLLYSLYFLILGKISWGTDCLYSGLCGLLLVFFVLIFREGTKRYVEYLPLTEKFYFYLVAFLYPIFILIVVDCIAIIENYPFHMAILLAPISYIAGISVFIGYGICLKLYSIINKIALRKIVLHLPQAILLLLIGDLIGCLYLLPYLGNLVFFVGLLMCFVLYAFELVYDGIRQYKRHKLSVK